jgi:Superfamily II DNA/RNA helicases, SNF2 family
MPLLTNDQKKEFKDAKSVVKYVDLKIRGECLGRILTKERIQCHVDMLPYIDFKAIINTIKKKTIVFTGYVKVVDAVYNQLSKEGYSPLKIYADTNSEIKTIVEKFRNDPNANPMIATFDSLSTAVPLTMANGIIFLNNPWRSYIKEQAVARAHRIGQDQPVYCFDVILDTGNVPNISSRSLDIMQWSKDQVDKIMGTNGAVEVSVEQYGFVTKTTADINDVLDDISYERKLELHNYVERNYTEDVESDILYPDHFNLYKQR